MCPFSNTGGSQVWVGAVWRQQGWWGERSCRRGVRWRCWVWGIVIVGRCKDETQPSCVDSKRTVNTLTVVPANGFTFLGGGEIPAEDGLVIRAVTLVVVQLKQGQRGEGEGRGAFLQDLAVDVQQRVQLWFNGRYLEAKESVNQADVGFLNVRANGTGLSPVSPLYTRAPAYSCLPGNLHLDAVCPLFSYPRESGPFPESDPPCYTNTHTKQSQYKCGNSRTCSGIGIRWTLVKHTTRSMPDWLLICENSSSRTPSLFWFHFLNVKYFNRKDKHSTRTSTKQRIYIISHSWRHWNRKALQQHMLNVQFFKKKSCETHLSISDFSVFLLKQWFQV